MRSLLAASTFLIIASPAIAADEVVNLSTGHDWSGFYMGAAIGAGAVVHDIELGGALGFNGIGGEGLVGQVTAGYDFLLSERFLIGAFADGRYGNVGTELSLGPVSIDAQATTGFDVGIRAGYLVTPSTLAYVLGGYSHQQYEISSSPAGLAYDWNADGYFVGAGVETALSGSFTLKTEYRYASYGSEDFDTAGLIDVSSSSHTVLAGINYRFGFDAGVPASVVAPVYDWTGFHVGGAVGAGGLVHDLSIGGGVLGFNGIGAEGVSGELSAGYDHDFGGWVGGLSVGGRFSTVATSLSAGPLAVELKADYGFDVLARFGKKLGDATLAYVIGGYSWQHFDVDVETVGSIYDWSADGFTVGAGVEAAVSDRTTVNLEYRYSDYSGHDFGSPGLVDVEPSSHTVRAGLKFKLF